MIPLHFNMEINTDIAHLVKVENIKNNLKEAEAEPETAKLEEAVIQFEAYFLNVLLKEMRKSIPQYDDYLGGGRANEIYQSMLDEKLAEEMAGSKNFGLSQLLKEELQRLQ